MNSKDEVKELKELITMAVQHTIFNENDLHKIIALGLVVDDECSNEMKEICKQQIRDK